MRILRTTLAGLLSVGFLALASSTSAGIVTVLNFSFENPVTDGTTNPSATDWTNVGSVGVVHNDHSSLSGPIEAQDGVQALFANTGGSVSQSFASELLTAGTTYDLIVGVGTRTGDTAAYVLEIRAGGDVLSTVSATFPDTGGFTDVPLSYLATGAEASINMPLEIRIASTQVQTLFDNVRLTSTPAIPEPSSLVLVGLGMLGLLGYRRRQK